jgi:hypothetical protein
VFVDYLTAKYVGMFLLGCLFFRNVQAYILSTEYVPDRNQVHVATALLSLDAVGIMLGGVYFKWISNDWKYLYYFFFAVIAVFTILTMFLLEFTEVNF